MERSTAQNSSISAAMLKLKETGMSRIYLPLTLDTEIAKESPSSSVVNGRGLSRITSRGSAWQSHHQHVSVLHAHVVPKPTY